MRHVRAFLVILAIASSLPAMAVGAVRAIGAGGGAERSSDLPRDWLATVQDSILRSEYQASRGDDLVAPGAEESLQAPNRAHGLRTSFTPSGVQVIPRDELTPSWTWGLRLDGFGFDGALQEAGPSDPVALGNRVEYQRGELIEWYVNDQRGLEQGFTFTSPPGSIGTVGQSRARLVVELGLAGSLVAALSDGGGSIGFTTPSGVPVLGYDELKAWDATGRILPAALELETSGTTDLIRIAVDPTGAVYPLTIDPLVRAPQWNFDSDQRIAWLGYAVRTAGDVNGDGYGDVVVGAYRYDAGRVDEGKAWAFYGSPAGLSTDADWTVDGPWPGALLGHSVGTAGDVNGDGYGDVIMGVPSPKGGTEDGWAYTYYGSATGLSTTPDWTVMVEQDAAWFGRSVRTAGDVNGDGYGDVIVGAPHYDNGQLEEGKAWLYQGSPTGLSTTHAWTDEGDQAWALFGRHVGTAGDVNGDGYGDVVVGAHFWDDDQFNEGRAFAYYGSPSGLHNVPDWTADGNQTEAWFARAIGTAGDVNGDGYGDVIAAAPKYDNDQVNEGRAFAFYGSATGLSATPDWTAEADQAEAWFGRRVATAGDVNGDGFSDVIVGAPNYDTLRPDGGRVYVFHGSATGLGGTQAWTAQSNQDHAWFGRSVAPAGDVNGDGYSDVIVGAPLFDNGQKDEGRAFVFHGSEGGLRSG